jgi:hypothetical protein
MNALPWRLAPTLRLFPQPSVRYGPFSEATPINGIRAKIPPPGGNTIRFTQKAPNGEMLYPDGSIEIPANGDLPPILIAVTELESSDPALKAFGFLTWSSLDAGLSFANLPAWLYVGTLRIQRFLMVRFAERLLLNRICTQIQRLLVQAYRISFQITHGKVAQ